GGGVPEHVEAVRPIRQKASRLCVLTQSIHCGQPVSCRKVCDTCTVILKHRIYQNDHPTGLLVGHCKTISFAPRSSLPPRSGPARLAHPSAHRNAGERSTSIRAVTSCGCKPGRL